MTDPGSVTPIRPPADRPTNGGGSNGSGYGERLARIETRLESVATREDIANIRTTIAAIHTTIAAVHTTLWKAIATVVVVSLGTVGLHIALKFLP